jgi:hypothetical protein
MITKSGLPGTFSRVLEHSTGELNKHVLTLVYGYYKTEAADHFRVLSEYHEH